MSTMIAKPHHVQFVTEIIARTLLPIQTNEDIGTLLTESNYEAYNANYNAGLTPPKYTHVSFKTAPTDDLFTLKQLFFFDYQCDFGDNYRTTIAGMMMQEVIGHFMVKLTKSRYPQFRGLSYQEFIGFMNDVKEFRDLPYGLDRPYVDDDTLKADKFRASLAGFYGGTNKYYKSAIFCNWIFHTDGIQWLAKNGAGWLVDVIVSYQGKDKFKREEFQVWNLTRRAKKGGGGFEWVVTCDDGGKGTKPVKLCTQIIPYSDFPLQEGIKIYVEDGSLDGGNTRHKIIMLPSER